MDRLTEMWPFSKRADKPRPANVHCDGTTAHYDTQFNKWAFRVDGIEFMFKGVQFDPVVTSWARESSATIRGLEGPLRACVMEWLKEWPCDHSRAEIVAVDLSKYTDSRTFDIAFAGDESWGDFGVNVIVKDGQIFDSYAGD